MLVQSSCPSNVKGWLTKPALHFLVDCLHLICSNFDLVGGLAPCTPILNVSFFCHNDTYICNPVLCYKLLWIFVCVCLQAYCFHADKEQLRESRIVRVGLIQNSIASPTTAPFLDQRGAIFEKLKPIIDAAGASGVNILCLQVSYALRIAWFYIRDLPITPKSLITVH